MIAGNALVVGFVADVGLIGNVKVGDDDRVEVFRSEVGNHLVEVGEALGIDGGRGGS